MENKESKPLPIKTLEEQIREAVANLQKALIENIEAGKAETDAKLRKKKAYQYLLDAKSQVYHLEREVSKDLELGS